MTVRIEVETKVCRDCDDEKDSSEYYRGRDENGFMRYTYPYCKDCCAKRRRESRARVAAQRAKEQPKASIGELLQAWPR